MVRIYNIIEAVAPSSASVLIVGESGTGKELVARAIHNKSHRAKGPFVALNCGAFPREILENELFGHEKGAFTGAINEKPGAFEQADGGTLFLDEVAEMEPDIQVKFLRALEQRSFRRLGGKKEVQVDIRVVAATNKNIEEALRDGKLRDDLYHRLAVIPLHLPPLREREGDVRLLAEEFLRRFAKEQDKEIAGFSEGAIEYITTYRWPGNVRELKNSIERAVILARSETLETADLLPRHLAYDEKEVHIPIGTSLEDSERQLTLKTFAFAAGDHRKTAAHPRGHAEGAEGEAAEVPQRARRRRLSGWRRAKETTWLTTTRCRTSSSSAAPAGRARSCGAHCWARVPRCCWRRGPAARPGTRSGPAPCASATAPRTPSAASPTA
jgi:DNA-binding NtrC family response regulator